jgi:hypothetical protein
LQLNQTASSQKNKTKKVRHQLQWRCAFVHVDSFLDVDSK